MMTPRDEGSPPKSREDARRSKAEDFLGYDLALYLADLQPESWRRYVTSTPTGLEFKLDAKSANHKAMASLLELLMTGSHGAQTYWEQRLLGELGDLGLGQGEPRSNKYAAWSLAAILQVGRWAASNGHAKLELLVRAYYEAWCLQQALGSTERPARNLTAGTWSGVYVSATGVRSDPGHIEGDLRAWVLQTELFGAPSKDVYRSRALARRGAILRTKSRQALDLQERKVVSELWPVDAIVDARLTEGLRLKDEYRSGLKRVLQGLDCPPVRPEIRSRHTFHHLLWADGTRASYLEDSLGERCIFGDKVSPDGAVEVLFPYDLEDKSQMGGVCGFERHELVARREGGRASFELPDGDPVRHVVLGPGGLEVRA